MILQLLGAATGYGVRNMETGHWVMIAVVAAVVFVFARTQMGGTLASKVGLS